MSKPDISIIVPVYNVERYLDECLDSLLEQTHRNIEIICVNDGSTDSSLCILERRASEDDRIRVISQENAGVAHSRNIALDAAQGDYVLFVDSDDYIDVRTCELLLSNARETDADIVVFGGKTFPTMHWADASFASRDAVYKNDSIQALLYEPGSTPLMCNKMYRRSLIEEGGFRFNDGLKLGEDNAFQHCIFPEAKVVSYVKDRLYFYRGRPDSAVVSRKDKHGEKLAMHFDVVKHVIKEWTKRGLTPGHERELLEWACTFLHNDAPETPFNDRARFSRDFDAFVNEYFAPSVCEGLSEPLREKLHFLQRAWKTLEEPPIFSVVVFAGDDTEDPDDGVNSLAFQTEQRLELLFVGKGGESGFDAMCERIVNDDARARIVDQGGLQGAIESVRGRYVLVTNASSRYERTALRHVLSVSKEVKKATDTLPDLITLSDAAGSLGAVDAFDAVKPSFREGMATMPLFSNENFRSRLFDFSSLALENKVFAAPFLKETAQRLPASDGHNAVQLCVQALASCPAIYVSNLPILTVGALHFASEQSAEEHARCMVEDVQAAWDWTERALSAGEGTARDGFARSVLKLLLVRLESVRSRSCFLAYHNVAAPPILARFGQGADRYVGGEPPRWSERLQDLASLSSAELFDRQNELLVDRLTEMNGTNLLMVGDFAAQANKLSADIEEFYGSISYRTGRAVTFLPRMAVNALKRVAGKRG